MLLKGSREVMMAKEITRSPLRQGDQKGLFSGAYDAASFQSAKTPRSTPARNAVLRLLWRERWVYLLLLPGLVYFVLFYYIPLLGNVAAFQDFSPYLGFFRSPWVGVQNFLTLLTDPAFVTVVGNTLLISCLQIVFAFPAGIVLALALNAIMHERFKRFMQSVLYLPHFLSWVIIISIWQQIVGGDGFISHMLLSTGGHPLNIISNPDWFKPMIVLQVMWKETGWSTIMFLAAITAIDGSLYESAAIDGAGKWRQMWHVTLPGMRNIIIFLLILRLGNVLSVGFEQILLQQQGLTSDVTQVIDTFSYSRGILSGDWGLAAAADLFKAVIGVILIWLSNRIAKKFGEEGVF